jgi:lipopolysaccharide/colanic/teichoic acid biosynthesis glycosyltransferase
LNSDAGLHKDYVAKFIAGRPDVSKDKNGRHIFKIKHDPRITPFGEFLRRTSLDELPQLFNVLNGEMSLVGPRPALPYEVARYQPWHRRRIWEAKPGITGLWQVRGRSRLTFDEMVRLDLEYCRKASLLLDFQILLQTPAAVLSGNGAY